MFIFEKIGFKPLIKKAVLLPVIALVFSNPSFASDHNEAPLVKADGSMDITDLYIFDSGEDRTTAIICFAGFNDSVAQPITAAIYNPDALYTLNIDNNGDNRPDISVYWRYGMNDNGVWGVQVENLPGSDGTVSGPVENVFDAGNGTRVWSGLADDPFFFDVEGYLDTLATGTLSIRSDRDSLAGLNVTAIAMEMSTSAMLSGLEPLRFWVTSARK